MHPKARAAANPKPLKGVRILSLALNLPGPAALMRCQAMGARCTKLEPPAAASAPPGASGDPMQTYSPAAYHDTTRGVRTLCANLKTDPGRRVLQRELSKADVLLTSFRPSALTQLGLSWKELHRTYPHLSMIAIVGAPGARAEQPGHDLTYMAENDLITGLDLPPSLYADMGGSLMVSEAVLQARLLQVQQGKSIRIEVALSEAASYLGLPRRWRLTLPGAVTGGGHAGYRVYACKNGRVALAALEPHFAAALAELAGIADVSMFSALAHTAIRDFVARKTRRQLQALAAARDIPLHTWG